jgi:SAM-dependent methyltransferase
MTGAKVGQWFGQVAEEYDRWRPSYPSAAVDWLAPEPPARVLEVGAGTGKLTSLLVARGLEVDAVEPDDLMREVLARNNPGTRTQGAESTSLPASDASLDAVLVADAWHWFDASVTLAEVRRVLKPGGWLGLVWNNVAEPVASWERELDGPSDQHDRTNKGTRDGIARYLPDIPAAELEFRSFPWVWDLSPQHRARYLATTSMSIMVSEDERALKLAEDLDALQRVCDANGRESMPIRYEASCVRWTPALLAADPALAAVAR